MQQHLRRLAWMPASGSIYGTLWAAEGIIGNANIQHFIGTTAAQVGVFAHLSTTSSTTTFRCRGTCNEGLTCLPSQRQANSLRLPGQAQRGAAGALHAGATQPTCPTPGSASTDRPQHPHQTSACISAPSLSSPAFLMRPTSFLAVSSSDVQRQRHQHQWTLSRAICTSVAICDVPRPTPPSSQKAQAQQPQRQTADSQAAASSGPTAQSSATQPGPQVAAADAVYNLPNAVSVARLLSGPVIGYWLLHGQYEVATIALAISGASDWLDGFLARRLNASSVFGSYLDPLADKVLIGCVAAALLANGSMPVWLAVVVVGRDLVLVSGAFAMRLRGFGWRWPGREAFFRTADTAGPVAPASLPALMPGKGDTTGASSSNNTSSGTEDARGGGVAYMRPLMISKANTVLQLVLLGGYITRGMCGWPEGDVVEALEIATAATTVASLGAYVNNAAQGKLFK